MMKVIAAVGSIVLVFAGQVLAQPSEAATYSQKALLKNWALSRCLAHVYSDARTKADADATASAYLESGRQPLEAYSALSELVNKYANRQYAGSIKSEFNTMKCIDLFQSQELDKLAGKLSKAK